MRVMNLKTITMKVEFKIENDEDLRSYIKKCIKDQVVSIAREELVEAVKTELFRKVFSSDPHSIANGHRSMLQAAVSKGVIDILRSQGDALVKWQSDIIEPMLKSAVTTQMEKFDWNAAINRIATERLEKFIKG